MGRKKEVTIDDNQNLSNGYSELKSYSSYKVLLTKFVKKFSTTDTTNQDIDIGNNITINFSNNVVNLLSSSIYRTYNQ